jgi:hypothetical protein
VIARVALVFAMGVSMAKPPEPLEEIFPQTALIVDAEVVTIKDQGVHTEGVAIARGELPPQVLVLKVTRVVRGALAKDEAREQRIIVRKPKAPYTVRVGVKGPWLLGASKDGERLVLGRYGPDSWTFEKIDLKLKELDPPHLRASVAR